MSARSERPRPVRGWWLTIWMVGALGAILGGAVWFGARANDTALEDFSHEQAVLASAVSIDVEARLGAQIARGGGESAITDEVLVDLLAGARRLEKSSELMLLLARPNGRGFLSSDGRLIASTRVRDALDRHVVAVVLPRDEAANLGLPRRRAVAGLARVASQSTEPWGVVVVASAIRMRERQEATAWRLGFTTVFAAGVVAAIGAYARRRMQRAFELERDLALAQADKMATLAALSTGIAHELGTPLSVIVGRVEQVLGRSNMDERSTSALHIVLEQVERIERIVRGSLALARGDAPQLVPTAPPLVARRATELVRHRFEKAEVELVSRLEEGLGEMACDASLFEQALVNLLLNACQASSPGGVVTLAVQRRGTRIAFVVEDDGAGIPDAVAGHAVEPFFTTKRGEGGAGLGLTIAREIVKHHNGAISVVRREGGRGTRATIEALTA